MYIPPLSIGFWSNKADGLLHWQAALFNERSDTCDGSRRVGIDRSYELWVGLVVFSSQPGRGADNSRVSPWGAVGLKSANGPKKKDL
jgi:hypothetical protein